MNAKNTFRHRVDAVPGFADKYSWLVHHNEILTEDWDYSGNCITTWFYFRYEEDKVKYILKWA